MLRNVDLQYVGQHPVHLAVALIGKSAGLVAKEKIKRRT